MSPEAGQHPGELSRREILSAVNHYKLLIERRFVKLKKLRAAAIVREVQGSYEGLEIGGWEYVIDRQQAPDKSVTTISVTRFPTAKGDQAIVSEGIRFRITNPKFSSLDPMIEYHKKTKENPEEEPISNTPEARLAVGGFVSSV